MTAAIGILGAGAWGTALAQVLASAGRAVTLYAREAEIVQAVRTRRENPALLPGIALSPNLEATGDLGALAKTEALLIVVPAQAVRAALSAFKPHARPGTPLLLCAKGFEISSGKRLSEICTEILPENPVGVLTGPSFAREVALGLPCALTLALVDEALRESLASALNTRSLRIYTSADVIGAETGGAVKNVVAIACGIAAGLRLGENARAALVTRGLAEIARLAVAMGGKRETLTGLSGLGDLILTATSATSRNFAHGLALGQGSRPEGETTVEGVTTARALKTLAARHGVEMPIGEAVYRVLYENLGVREAVESLLSRPGGIGE